MSWTRRQFLVAASFLAPAAAARVQGEPASAATPAPPHDDPACLVGDAYLACVEGPGLGGRTFEEARERAFRFRTPAAQRDRYLLGVETDDA